MRDEFYFPSKDGNTEIHTMEWKPEGEVKAVVQLCHGMVEYIKRYDEFAEFLCSHGYYVVGNDHLGHGESVQSKSEYGFFNEKYANACLIGDMHTLRQRTAKKYPDVPYFMLGHSMGSSLLRQYVQMYGNGLAGAIFMGVVADKPYHTLVSGRRLCRFMAAFRGWHYRSRLIDRMAVGAFAASGRVCVRSSLLLYVHCKCVLRDVYRDAGNGEEGKHLYDSKESANPFYGRS